MFNDVDRIYFWFYLINLQSCVDSKLVTPHNPQKLTHRDNIKAIVWTDNSEYNVWFYK